MQSLSSLVVAILLLTFAGNWACKLLFKLTGLNGGSATTKTASAGAGRIIGALERLAIAVGIVMQSWEVLAAVVALKSVARFKELDDQKFAEYFLVGSLFSMLWSVLITTTWMVYDHHMGNDIRAKITHMMEVSETTTENNSQPKTPTN